MNDVTTEISSAESRADEWHDAMRARLPAAADCLRVLVRRSLAVRYRRSVLGFAWSLLQPLTAMAVLTIVFARVFPQIERYPLYVIVGVFAWGFFSLTVTQSMDSLHGAAPILRKVATPPVLFPLAVVAANLVHLVLSLGLLCAIGMAFGFVAPLAVVAAVPALLPLVLLTVAAALVLSAANVFFHDVRYFVEGMLLIGFYATPVVYPWQIIPPELSAFVLANPMHWALVPLRDVLWQGHAPDVTGLALTIAGCAVLTAAAAAAFARLSRSFHLYL